jgi:hypothetical protein
MIGETMRKRMAAGLAALALAIGLGACNGDATGGDEPAKDTATKGSDQQAEVPFTDVDIEAGPLFTTKHQDGLWEIFQLDLETGEPKTLFENLDMDRYREAGAGLGLVDGSSLLKEWSFDPKMEKMAVTWDVSDSDTRVGWLDRHGEATDVTEAAGVDPKELNKQVGGSRPSAVFSEEGLFYFDDTSETTVVFDPETMKPVGDPIDGVCYDANGMTSSLLCVLSPDGVMVPYNHLTLPDGTRFAAETGTDWEFVQLLDDQRALFLGENKRVLAVFEPLKDGELRGETYYGDDAAMVAITPPMDVSITGVAASGDTIVFTGGNVDARAVYTVAAVPASQPVKLDYKDFDYLVLWK